MQDNPFEHLPSDEQLAAEAQAGCAASFEQLVRRLQVPLVHFLLRRTRCFADAEDLAQDALVRAHRGLANYSAKWRFRTWLFTIAHRLAINLSHRRRREGQTSAAVAEIPARAADPGDVLAREEARQSLWNTAAGLLGAGEVSALWLHYVEELSTAEVAQVLGRSRMSVKTMLFRARKRLEPHLRALVDVDNRGTFPLEALPDSIGTGFKVANA